MGSLLHLGGVMHLWKSHRLHPWESRPPPLSSNQLCTAVSGMLFMNDQRLRGTKASFLSRFSDCMGLNSLVKPLSYLLIYQHGNNSYLSRRSLSGGRKLLGYALALRFAPQCISTLNPNFWDLLSTAALDTCITSFDNKGSYEHSSEVNRHPLP